MSTLAAWANRFATGGRFTPAAPQEDDGGPHLTMWPGEVNDRFSVRVFPQEAPDPSEMGGAYGEIPSRPAQSQVVTFFHDQNIAMGEESFIAAIIPRSPGAAIPRGRMQPFDPRANIARPAAVAYGSLFEYRPQTYGMG